MAFETYNFKNQKQNIDKLTEILEFATLDFSGAFEPENEYDDSNIIIGNVIQPQTFICGGRLIHTTEKLSLTGGFNYIQVIISGDNLNLSTDENLNISITSTTDMDTFKATFPGWSEDRPQVTAWNASKTVCAIAIGEAGAYYLKNANKEDFLGYLSDENYEKVMDYVTTYCAYAKKGEAGEGNYQLGKKIIYDDYGKLQADTLSLNMSSFAPDNKAVVVFNGDTKNVEAERTLSVEHGGTGAQNALDAKTNLGITYGPTKPTGTTNPKTLKVAQEGEIYLHVIS